MTRNNASKKLGLRRIAPFMAALGMLVMSSGLALMVTATPANAASTKVNICHATSSDSNPYVFIQVDDDSVKFKGHLKHREDPNKTWQGIAPGHTDGELKPDLIGDFTDDKGVKHVYDGTITQSDCEGEAPSPEAVADVDFTDPTCENGNEASYDTTGSNVEFSVKPGTGPAAPGNYIVVVATATGKSTFDGGGTTMEFEWTFDPAVDLEGPPCVIVDNPTVATASVDFINPSCANGNVASYTTEGENVIFSEDVPAAPGGDITVTATATGEATFADGDPTVHTASFTFDAAEADCAIVDPPIVTPEETAVATPTLVHAGIVNDVSTNVRGEQGLALLVVGMLMMAAAGGLGLIRSGGQARR